MFAGTARREAPVERRTVGANFGDGVELQRSVYVLYLDSHGDGDAIQPECVRTGINIKLRDDECPAVELQGTPGVCDLRPTTAHLPCQGFRNHRNIKWRHISPRRYTVDVTQWDPWLQTKFEYLHIPRV